jgi:putative ABC transport system ATP-binding protein
MKTILEARGVSKIYEGSGMRTVAVDNVSIDIHQGEFVALVGPSGSGKTTLLALIAGLLQPSTGEVVIAGESLWKLNDAKRTAFRAKQIGFIFQSSNLVPYLSAVENVELMLKLNGTLDVEGRAWSRELLGRLGMDQRISNLPTQMSGGQQQRVAIARALVHQPAIVLADEPTASLDTERALQVVQTLASLIHEQGRAGVMVTHDLRMCRYVDRVVRMTDGRIAQVITDRAEIEAFAGAMDAAHA